VHLHEIARHLLHSNETLDVAVDTIKRLLASYSRLFPPEKREDQALTYSITEPVKSPNWSKYAKTTTTFFALLCLNHKTRYRSNTKGDFRLPYRPIVLAISEATGLLLEHLTLNNNDYLNAPEESLFALKLCPTALNLHALKSKQLSNISLTSIREDLRPGCARCRIWQINY
jgi:hypothetical protein